MSSRIEEQNNQSFNRAILEKQRGIQKKSTQRAFANDLKSHSIHEKKRNLSANETRERFWDNKKPEKAPEKPIQAPKKSPEKECKKANSHQEAKRGQTRKDKLDERRTKNDAKKKQSNPLEKNGAEESEIFFSYAAVMGVQGQQEQAASLQTFGATLSTEIMSELVDKIYTIVDTNGQKELIIELKNGVLSGAKIRVSSQGKKVQLQFSIENPQTRALLQNSRQAISNRLKEKNISLMEFVVH